MKLTSLANATMLGTAFTLLAGCGGESAATDTADDTATISLSLMDRPVDGVSALYVTITGMRLAPAAEDQPPFDLPLTEVPITVNLLELGADNASVLVDEAVIPAGRYDWLEMTVADDSVSESYAMTESGGMEAVDVDVPSGRIRLVSGFEAGPNQALRLLFDWDVRSGLVDPPGRDGFLLRPAFRVLDADELGTLTGTVSATTLADEASCNEKADLEAGNVVYVYEGDQVPDDIDGTAPEPVTTVDVAPDAGGTYAYRTVLAPGDYTVAFTCQGADDSDEGDDDLVFLSPTLVSIAGDMVVVDF